MSKPTEGTPDVQAAAWLAGPAAQQTIGVIGAGTMGAGIAQVAAASGHPVQLLDLRPGAAAAAIAQTAQALATLVDKGRLSAADRDATVARLGVCDSVAQMADAALVIEVIVENLEAKRKLLQEVEAVIAPSAVLASNTSSISITAIAGGLQHPQRVVGMHFFNPVPQMKLVEVVSGAETDAAVAQGVFDLARRWGKTPVHAKSTPGFIVNRIARPYYAEALALLQEQAALPATLDALARSAGFRMGPCELMDLIGHDVNFAVTQSVFEANYFDRRYMPSIVQKALLDGGRLGRKVGKGFYNGVPQTASALIEPAAADGEQVADEAPAPTLTLCGNGPLARGLHAWMTQRGLSFGTDTQVKWTGWRLGAAALGVQIHVTDGRTAMQLAAEQRCADLAVVDLPLLSDKMNAIAVAFAAGTTDASRRQVRAALQACGWQAMELRDTPALWAARTLCMLVNEGADAVHQGVCSEEGANLAMKLGTNWPHGPFEWLAALGVERVVAVLDHLHAFTRNERYRVSPLLQHKLWAARAA
jgi:3-hydroxybutyryl-CoA dehydrogenase